MIKIGLDYITRQIQPSGVYYLKIWFMTRSTTGFDLIMATPNPGTIHDASQ
jgi:hypothetical protein